MTTLHLNILEESAMEIIRALERLRVVEVIEEKAIQEPKPEEPKKSWYGAIENPSQELLDYADKVRAEWDHRI